MLQDVASVYRIYLDQATSRLFGKEIPEVFLSGQVKALGTQELTSLAVHQVFRAWDPGIDSRPSTLLFLLETDGYETSFTKRYVRFHPEGSWSRCISRLGERPKFFFLRREEMANASCVLIQTGRTRCQSCCLRSQDVTAVIEESMENGVSWKEVREDLLDCFGKTTVKLKILFRGHCQTRHVSIRWMGFVGQAYCWCGEICAMLLVFLLMLVLTPALVVIVVLKPVWCKQTHTCYVTQVRFAWWALI